MSHTHLWEIDGCCPLVHEEGSTTPSCVESSSSNVFPDELAASKTPPCNPAHTSFGIYRQMAVTLQAGKKSEGTQALTVSSAFRSFTSTILAGTKLRTLRARRTAFGSLVPTSASWFCTVSRQKAGPGMSAEPKLLQQPLHEGREGYTRWNTTIARQWSG